MQDISWNRILRIFGHLLFWLLICLIHYVISILDEWQPYYWVFMAWLMPFDLAAVYFTAYYLVPEFLLKKRYGRFFTILILSMVVIVLGQRVATYFVIYPQIRWEKALAQPFMYLPYFWRAWINTYSFAFLFSGIRLFGFWMKEQKRQKELEQQTMASEMALLRSQINPHFLFNTLNNILDFGHSQFFRNKFLYSSLPKML